MSNKQVDKICQLSADIQDTRDKLVSEITKGVECLISTGGHDSRQLLRLISVCNGNDLSLKEFLIELHHQWEKESK